MNLAQKEQNKKKIGKMEIYFKSKNSYKSCMQKNQYL